jgi:hypothetical protein
VGGALEAHKVSPASDIETALEADGEGRRFAKSFVERI